MHQCILFLACAAFFAEAVGWNVRFRVWSAFVSHFCIFSFVSVFPGRMKLRPRKQRFDPNWVDPVDPGPYQRYELAVYGPSAAVVNNDPVCWTNVIFCLSQ